MFITRASRHDKGDLKEFYASQDWQEVDVDRGVAFIARDGHIAAAARLVEVAPQTVVIDDVVVREDRRGEGLGRAVMQAAMNSRGGTLFLSCHDDKIGFYEKLGFVTVEIEDLPEAVNAYLEEAGDLPNTPEHVHYIMKAR